MSETEGKVGALPVKFNLLPKGPIRSGWGSLDQISPEMNSEVSYQEFKKI